jgi:hypothetical protein
MLGVSPTKQRIRLEMDQNMRQTPPDVPTDLPGFTASAQRRHHRGTRILLGFLATVGALFVAVVIAGIFIAISSPSSSTPAATAPVPVPTMAPPVAVPTPAAVPDVAASTFPAGIYEVGTGLGHIAPGKYHTDGEGSFGYWARLSGLSGDSHDIITNGMVDGPTTITIKASDAAVKFSGGSTWTRVA